MTNLTNYQLKSIRWVLTEKYNYTELEINKFIESADFEKVQGWVLAKPSRSYNLSNKALKDINRVLEGEPVDYVIGYKYFNNCKIDLSLKPLIPRVETEYWVNQVIDELKNDKSNKLTDQTKVLDIFCGSGCIGISVLKDLTQPNVTFADISNKCLEQTKLNLKLNNIDKTRYKIKKSNIFESLNDKFDLIFANPPYVPNRYVEMSKDLYYEPKVALVGGEQGVDVIDKFISIVGNYLSSNGVCYMEFGDNQEGEILSLVKKYGYKRFKIRDDQFNRARFLELNL